MRSPFWAVQRCADVSTHDRLHSRQFGGSVWLYGRLSSQPSRWANTPHQLGSIFFCLNHQWLRKKCFYNSNFGNSRSHDFGNRFSPYRWTHRRHRLLSPPLQDIQQLQRFLSMVNFYHCFLPGCAHILWTLTFLRGSTQNAKVDHLGWGGFSRCKTPPHQSSATLTPFPSGQAFFSQWRLRFSHRRRQPAIIGRVLVPPFLFQKVVWHEISLFHVWLGVVSSLCIHSTFPPFL